MDTAHSILKSARQFFAGTALSRVSGLLRDMAMAFSFGAAPEIAAFMVAYRLSNLFRRVLGEGNLQAGFVPYFESLRGKSQKEAFSFYRDSAYSLGVILAIVVFGIEALVWLFMGYLPEGWIEVAEFSLWMTPGLFFICLSALNSALLQCQKKYFAPAIAPVLFNGVWIAAAWAAYHYSVSEGVRILSAGVTLAFAAQWGATAFWVRKETKAHLDWKERLRPRLFSPEWKQIVRPMALGVLGIGAMQINGALDAIFARVADPAGPTYLWYAIRVQQLPLALFGIALSGALLPPLSRAVREGDFGRYQELLSKALSQAGALMAPCTFGLLALGASGLNLLYGRGQFTSSDITDTLHCLWAYGIALLPASFVLLLAAGWYAKKSYGSPTFASLLSVAVSAALNALFVFVFHWGAVSIAIATGVGAWLNCALLARSQPIDRQVGTSLIKALFASAAAAVLAIWMGGWCGDGTLAILRGEPFAFSRSFPEQMAQFACVGAVYLGSFLALARGLRLHEVFMFLQRSAGK